MKKVICVIVFIFIYNGCCPINSLAYLKLTCPNGGEKFGFGSDTLITWEGIAESDTVTLEYSIDKGNTWFLISSNATGLKYIWKNIPATASNECLVKIRQNQMFNISDYLPSIEWQKTYGGSGNDGASSIQETPDGGFIVAGSTNSLDGDITESNGGVDCWVMKLDKAGNIEWQKTYGDSSDNYAHSIQLTTNGAYVVAGYSREKNGATSADILKIDNLGNIIWKTVYNRFKYNVVNSIQQTDDGGYIAAGSTAPNLRSSSILLLKLDSFGNIDWEKAYSKEVFNHSFSVQQTLDGGYILAGATGTDPITGYPYIKKIDNLGNNQWETTIYSVFNDAAYSIKQTADGGYIVAGYITVENDYAQYLVMKLDIGGNIEWEKNYGGSGYDGACSIIQTTNGGFVVAGLSDSKNGDKTENKGDFDCWVVKLNSSGVLLWQKTMGGSSKDGASSIQQTADGGYIIAGESQSTDVPGCVNKGPYDMYIVKLANILELDQSDELFSIAAPVVNVSVKNDSAYAGQIRRLKLVFSNVKPEVLSNYAPNFEAKIRFQKTILTPLKKAERNVVNDSIYMNIKGTIGTSNELAQVLVIAGLGNVEETSIDIVNFILTDNSGNKVGFDIKTQPGIFKLLGICNEGGTRLINPSGKVEILQIYPNPASDDIEISVNLIEEGMTTLSVFNSNGVKIKEFNITGETGLRTINLDVRDMCNGLYFIQLQTPTVVTNQKLMIVK